MAAAESSKRTIWRSATAGGRCAAWRRATDRKRQRTRVHATSTTCGGDSRAGASLHACAVGATISGWRPLLRSAIPHGPGGCASASPTRGRTTPTGSGPPTPRRWSLQPLDAHLLSTLGPRTCGWCPSGPAMLLACRRALHADDLDEYSHLAPASSRARWTRACALHQALPAFARE